jgi:hypothetical protein
MFQQEMACGGNINTADSSTITHLSAGYIPRRRREKMQRETFFCMYTLC